eukprot:CAMPEP_0197626652 /NCGR_PEP_ID=MMETSP1338-20131121/5520_1 /TAXON_ID=43686 ORGANISM="Pelagodinium beii, Strain RCC1491" /NCGR_SAMPLE_ID=MMETSP1338 /ASSEMBLY_ACC=CAM_ASM_000754 /LENGTH=239 /DNA_ID=CAMNT_0043197201 /DNA_START=48 /DNA_END=767 /DNA_ORIENTATION=+
MAGRPVAPEDLEGVPTIELLTELKRRHHLLGREPAHVAVLGPPCVGKHTQTDGLRRGFGICRITAAELTGPPPGSSGQASGSVDERAMSNLSKLLDRPQCRRGFVLEGFPFTVPQASRLQEELERRKTPLDAVVFLEAPEDALMERCRGRLFHPASGRLYHDQLKPPIDEGLDDYTGDALLRPPYEEEKFRASWQLFQKDSDLLRQFFSRKGLVRNVDAAERSGSRLAKSCSGRWHVQA